MERGCSEAPRHKLKLLAPANNRVKGYRRKNTGPREAETDSSAGPLLVRLSAGMVGGWQAAASPPGLGRSLVPHPHTPQMPGAAKGLGPGPVPALPDGPQGIKVTFPNN